MKVWVEKLLDVVAEEIQDFRRAGMGADYAILSAPLAEKIECAIL